METNPIVMAAPIGAECAETESPGKGTRMDLGWCWSIVLAVSAVGSFQLALIYPALAWMVLGYLGCLLELRRLPTARRAFYFGLLIGLGVYVPQMHFLWTIFGAAALPLWLILAFFHALFLLMLNRAEARWGTTWSLVLAPVLWCGIEYFRGEVWWLRFSWFTAGSVFQDGPQPLLTAFGVYGAGLLCTAVVAAMIRFRRIRFSPIEWLVVGFVTLLVLACLYPANTTGTSRRVVRVAGVQLEAPGVPEVVFALNRLATSHPDAELVLLSEYTFDGFVPEIVRTWCRQHQKWLIAGGRQAAADPGVTEIAPGTLQFQDQHRPLEISDQSPGDRFFNTAFVVNPEGQIIFSQAKSRPIQFFRDGEPAREQRLWNSPWGPIGIAICYDASYRRVMDVLVRSGAEALLIPTMDLESWGEWQHQLNARMSRIRALEYGLPIFRVASSGVSLLLNRRGWVVASAPFPGSGAMISGDLQLNSSGGTVPLDAWLAPGCTMISGGVLLGLLLPKKVQAAIRRKLQ